MYEIERKYLLKNDSWKSLCTQAPRRYRQAYLSLSKARNLRVRITDNEAFLTIKAKVGDSLVKRIEFEYPIPVQDAEDMITHLSIGHIIQKTRYILPADMADTESDFKFKWEIDVFEAENEGLLVAEIELPHENFSFKKPDWLGEEVTEDTRYINACLALKPFKEW